VCEKFPSLLIREISKARKNKSSGEFYKSQPHDESARCAPKFKSPKRRSSRRDSGSKSYDIGEIYL
jgi:hypothetical protein